MPAKAAVVHKLMISREALEIMAEAIKVLTLRQERFQRLKDVVAEAIGTIDPNSLHVPPTFMEHAPLEGAIPIHLRLSKELNSELDQVRNVLCEQLGDHCGVRETVVFCAMMIAKE